MKKILAFIIAFSVSYQLNAQKISVTTAVESIGEGYNSVYRVFIPHAQLKSVEKEWNRFLKDNKAKVRGPKDAPKGENAIIRGLGNDTLQIYSKISALDSGILLITGLERNGVFINPILNSQEDQVMKQVLHDMADRVSRKAINDETKDASSKLKDQLKEEKSLVKRNERLAADNERMRKLIKSQESSITKNEEDLQKLRSDIEEQRRAIEVIKDKSKELE